LQWVEIVVFESKKNEPKRASYRCDEKKWWVCNVAKLNTLVDVSGWNSKTPYASIRRIVQVNKEFFKIKPGLWALRECEKSVLEKFEIKEGDRVSEDIK